MPALTDLTIAGALAGLAKGEYSSRELTEAHLAAMEAGRALNAFITETPERALEMASASDAQARQGEARPLEGIPLAIKDLFCTEGVLTTAGSHILDGFTPPYELTVTANLWQAGAVMLGKLNMDEFAMGSSNTTQRLRPGARTPGAAAATIGSWCRAARPAARRRRSRRARPWPRPAPTPAARSASRRASPASSA